MKRSYLSRLTLIGIAATVMGGEACSGSQQASNTTDVGVNSILFIKRQWATFDANGNVTAVDVAGGNNQVLDYQRYVPGGSLNLLTPARADGTVINLTSYPQFAQADFNGADVSFDATQAVFSMKKDANDRYHIYTVQLTASADGTYEIHQKTAGDYDDVSPIYIPGGRIAFTTNEMYTAMGTRADEYEHAREALQFATISVAGGDADRRLGSQNISHTVAPFLRADGAIGFSQWEHKGAVNDVKIRVTNPDGTQIRMVAGQHSKPSDALFSVKEFAPNQMVGIATSRERTIHSGALVLIDARNQNDPVCLGGDINAMQGHACIDEENVQFQVITPNVPTDESTSPAGRYREPSVLPDGQILTSWADGPVNDLNEQSATAPDFGIYVFNQATQTNELIYNDRNTWDLNALAVAPRVEPPVISDLQNQPNATLPGRIGSVNITQTSLNDTIDGAEFSNVSLGDALKAATKVRVIEGFSSEAAKGVSMFGLTMEEGAAVLGEATIYPDGSWLADIPAYLPVRMQPVDKFELAIRSQQLWMQTQPGENRRCPGCHESRTANILPARQTMAERSGAQPFYTTPVNQREEIPWNANEVISSWAVQPILDAHCVQCHNATQNGNQAQSYYQITRTDPVTGAATTYNIPYLDLSSTPITVVYDKKVYTWPASYVSIFYPSSLQMMDGMSQITITGNVPPMWGVPGSARASVLTQKVNLHAVSPADGTTAWPGAFHPEDVGGSMTDLERLKLLLPMDLGGQYYARQNTGFTPYLQDPVAAQ